MTTIGLRIEKVENGYVIVKENIDSKAVFIAEKQESAIKMLGVFIKELSSIGEVGIIEQPDVDPESRIGENGEVIV